MIESIPALIATLAIVGMAVFGFQSLALTLLYLHHRWRPPAKPPTPAVWPAVTVQLPVFNEKFVVERLIDAACALDYPRHLLSIQVLDDSSDETTLLASRRVAHHRGQGIDIRLLHRSGRHGYKAGALAAGLRQAPGELIAIFDADFVPPSDFLRRLVPYLAADPGLGLVQARCGHLNAGYNWLTRVQAIALDSHFVIIQTARSRSGLLFNFNGTAGIWRRSCIEQSGGWQTDVLTEDLDLSYRAQMRGWRFAYVPDVIVPGEIPIQLAAYKQQQYRWACGGIGVLRKLGRSLWQAPLSLPQRIAAILHLASYLAQPLMLLCLLALPLAATQGGQVRSMPWLWPAGLGVPLLFFFSQYDAYPDWKRRLAYAPLLACVSVGLAVGNTLAVFAALALRQAPWLRTPKFHLAAPGDRRLLAAVRDYLPVRDRLAWAELTLAAYAAGALWLALAQMPRLVPILALLSFGFAFVTTMGLVESVTRDQ